MFAELIVFTLLPGCFGQVILQIHELTIVEQQILDNIHQPLMTVVISTLERKQQTMENSINERLSTLKRINSLDKYRVEDLSYKICELERLVKDLRARQNDLMETPNRTKESDADCQPPWVCHNSKCYKFFSDKKSFDEAQSDCHRIGANLAVPLTREENEMIAEVLNGIRGWIGVHDKEAEGTYDTITTGREISYSNWNSGEPNDLNGEEDCVELNFSRHGGWNDTPCGLLKTYVCERPVRTTND